VKQVAVVAGGGGFIGGHLVKALLNRGYEVRAVDIKPIVDWYQVHEGASNSQRDLSDLACCYKTLIGASQVYNLAADMGGMGFIESNRALCMLSVLINTNLLKAARDLGVKRYFFSSSACVYNGEKQAIVTPSPLTESDAYPAMPEDGYGWEKLFSERMCRHFYEDFGLETRIARYHNVYGPHGTYAGGREKAPAAICRKVIEAKRSGRNTIDIWGDGQQTRSFMFIDDCIKGTLGVMESDFHDPVNVGSSELVTINKLVTMVERIAGVKLERTYSTGAPTGVRGRNSDNTLIKSVLNWEPGVRLEQGLRATYDWIEAEIAKTTIAGVM
jgi:GDP-D-mannose 3', 5'-epimerase